MSFKRARSDDQKQNRIDEIVQASARIFDESGYEAVTFSTVSKLTNFTRPTIYKYFSSKEEILLKILNHDIQIWIDSLIDSFKINKIYDSNEVSAIWANKLASQKRMNELYSILFTILEKNASLEAITEFKKNMFESVRPLRKLLTQLYPRASSTQIQDFIMAQYSLAIGFYPMCHLNPDQIAAMKAISPSYTTPDFETEYRKAFYQLIIALEK